MTFKMKDITGQKFGLLTAVEPTNKRSRGGSVIWLFRCDCGNIKELQAGKVVGGNTNSCGCLRKGCYRRSPENKVIFIDDVAILRTNGKYDIEFTIDKDDYEKIRNYRWYINTDGYIIASDPDTAKSKKGHSYIKKIYLHRLIIDTPQNKQTDHINRDKTNNRKNNLRLCSHSENFGNRLKHKTYKGKPCTSKYKGVVNRQGNWVAQANFQDKRLISSGFKSEKQAALKYNEFALELFGRFAHLNDV